MHKQVMCAGGVTNSKHDRLESKSKTPAALCHYYKSLELESIQRRKRFSGIDFLCGSPETQKVFARWRDLSLMFFSAVEQRGNGEYRDMTDGISPPSLSPVPTQ